MTNLSRTEKYKELRDKLQNDTGSDITSKELSRFEKRLNRIDADNFGPATEYQEDYEAVHGRRTPAVAAVENTEDKSSVSEPEFDIRSLFASNANDSNVDNDYLDEYIREVKQYNIDQGNALSENTSMNVLGQMSLPARQEKPASRPYPASSGVAKMEDTDTADIPFTTPARKPAKPATSTPNTEQIPVIKPITADSSTLSKEDIMAEVQNLVNGNGGGYEEKETDTFETDSYHDRTTRQQLLNETTQMRAQLDDYEDNLNEVNDRMQHTNRILYMVLIVLIIVMVVVFGVLFYFIILSRGV